MSFPGLPFTTRDRHVQMWTEFIDRERFADRIHCKMIRLSKVVQNAAKLLRFDTVYFQIPILDGTSHQLVAHASADEHRPTASGSDDLR